MKKKIDPVIDKMGSLVAAGFGLVAALAWNEAIKSLFVGPCGAENAGALCYFSVGGPWIYAIVVTMIATFATLWIAKLSKK